MIKDLDMVALSKPLPEHGLVPGDVGTVVMVHQGGKAFTVEFMSFTGKTLAIVTVEATDLRRVRDEEVAHVRRLAAE